MPAAPKHPSVRARRNKTSTAATLVSGANTPAPDLPARSWHEMTLAWWRDIWASPMAPEYDASDRHGLFALALVVDDFWTAETPRDRKELAAEIRQQGQRFGLSPLDRRRLQWEIERTEEAQDKGTKRRASTTTTATQRRAPRTKDPRVTLHAV